jgi:hypothetical protein
LASAPERVALLAFALATLTASTAGAVPLLTGFGGPTGYGLPEHCLHPNDDGSYAGPHPDAAATPVAIDLRPAFPPGLYLFGRAFEGFYLNTNGNITFAAPLASPNAMPLPIDGQAMIAPWWADVDTRGGGQPSDNTVCFHVELNRVVVTWHDVGRHAVRNELRNDFQLILSTSGNCTSDGFDVEMRYHRCEWAAGEGPGATPALVGIDAGNRMNFVSLAQSRTAAVTELCTTSNVRGGEPGLHRFSIRGAYDGGGCTGAGRPCAVPGLFGRCAEGVTICAGMGTTCVAVVRPRAPRCDGFDNDCDGRVDDGPAVCGEGRACDMGLCQVRCSDDAGCAAGRSCSARGTCVEASCAAVTCPGGRRCQQGQCIDACYGITCPLGTRCQSGRCADPCEGVVCDNRDVCDGDSRSATFGQCVPGCQCRPCGPGSACRTDGHCVDEACADVTCPTGSTCERGACVDRCAVTGGARPCVGDEVCRRGRCLTPREAAADDAEAAAMAAARDAGVARDGATGALPMLVPGGCGCGVGGGRAGTAGTVVVALAWAVVLRRRRRG